MYICRGFVIFIIYLLFIGKRKIRRISNGYENFGKVFGWYKEWSEGRNIEKGV